MTPPLEVLPAQLTEPILHNYFRSSTSYRVRIALAVKGVSYGYEAYHLRKGEQRSDHYLALNAQGLVPALRWTDGRIYTQSLAIIELLDETIPSPPLLPNDPVGRARVRSLAQMIAIDIHPINNLRVLAELRRRFSADDDDVSDWFRHWVSETFTALEHRLSTEPETGAFCHGDDVSVADICLTAQVANNGRYGVEMTRYPTIQRIYERCIILPSFASASPANQPDAE